MIIKHWSQIGKRPSNEDAHTIIQNLDSKDKNIADVNFIGLYDGHGGSGVSKFMGDYGYKCFTQKLVKEFLDENRFGKYADKSFDTIEKNLEAKHPTICNRSGSTALCSLQFKTKKDGKLNMWMMNVGDSRAVLCNGYNIPVQLTKDHKPNNLEERKRIEQLGGKIAFDGRDWRVGDLSVSRAVGDVDNKPYVTHKPDIYKYKINRNDKFMIMGCDGLWDVLDNTEAVNYVLELQAGGMDPEKDNIAKKLTDLAIEAGSTDNVTAIIQFFK